MIKRVKENKMLRFFQKKTCSISMHQMRTVRGGCCDQSDVIPPPPPPPKNNTSSANTGG